MNYDIVGILVIGDPASANPSAHQTLEFWLAAGPEQESCLLNDFPRMMLQGLTVNLVSGRLVACQSKTCLIYQEGLWKDLQNTTVVRASQSSATAEDAVLLIGGDLRNSTEWIPVDGSPAQPGPFIIRHGWNHCTMQINDNVIVVTGGYNTESLVTEYQLDNENETPLTEMLGKGRLGHACGVYQDADGQQVEKYS